MKRRKEKRKKEKEKEKEKDRGGSRQALFQGLEGSVFRNVLRVNGSDPMTSLLCGEAN